jgi:hypothetical protein
MGPFTLLNLNCYITLNIHFVDFIQQSFTAVQYFFFVDVIEYSFIARAVIAQSV